jgi:hypothetical protein
LIFLGWFFESLFLAEEGNDESIAAEGDACSESDAKVNLLDDS